tara:strand:+ start:422 stop:973 length:552 start_codon:yes stop_codon:yes gene_type:complete
LIESHKLIQKNPLTENFKSSYGFIIKFTDKTAYKLMEHDLKPIYELFLDIRDPRCNYFQFNPLVIEPLNTNSPRHNSIEFHYDNHATWYSWLVEKKIYLPLFVSVIYVSLPEKFIGGNLVLKKFDRKKRYKKVRPSIGMHVNFRGDLFHGVEAIQSDEHVKRISLVFEQYSIPNFNPDAFTIN